LAAAGVGRLGVVDFDVVDESNLQRQILHGQTDLGRAKVDSALDAVREVNPHVEVVKHETRLDSSNALDVLAPYDVVIDGTDNFATRYLVNDACVLLGKPYVWGSIFRFDGQASVFWAGPPANGPCYRCLYPEPPPPGLVPSCAEGGVLGVLCGTVGSLLATEAIKLVTGVGRPLVGRLLLYDALDLRAREVKVAKDAECAVCGESPTVVELIDYEEFCGVPQGQPSGDDHSSIDVHQLAARLQRRDDLLLIDVREPFERSIVEIPGSVLVPKGRFMDGSALRRLPRDRQLVLYCRTGPRSAEVVDVLHESGFPDAVFVDGGVVAWVREIEPEKPTY
jgi:adenylyltransferase/sulfurtransferase